VELRIFSYKQGVLSNFGHDLTFALSGVLQLSEPRIEFEFLLGQLKLLGARPAPGPVDVFQSDRVLASVDSRSTEQIYRALHHEILASARFPGGRFEGEWHAGRATGTLELLGQRRPLVIDYHFADSRYQGSVELVPSQWGIRPYRAMLGALKLQDRVTVHFQVQAQLGA
jgi:hypothetical protein